MAQTAKIQFPLWYANKQPVEQWRKEIEFQGNRYSINGNEIKSMPLDVATAFVSQYTAIATIVEIT